MKPDRALRPVRRHVRRPVVAGHRSGTGVGMDGYAIVEADQARDFYEGTDVPGEFRRLTGDLGSQQLSLTLIRVPPHSDFEQGTGHFHKEIEEIYLVTRGRLTMRLGDDIHEIGPRTAVRVSPKTPRSHRNRGDEPVEMWAISVRLGRHDATRIEEFWEASPEASQHRSQRSRLSP